MYGLCSNVIFSSRSKQQIDCWNWLIAQSLPSHGMLIRLPVCMIFGRRMVLLHLEWWSVPSWILTSSRIWWLVYYKWHWWKRSSIVSRNAKQKRQLITKARSKSFSSLHYAHRAKASHLFCPCLKITKRDYPSAPSISSKMVQKHHRHQQWQPLPLYLCPATRTPTNINCFCGWIVGVECLSFPALFWVLNGVDLVVVLPLIFFDHWDLR